MSLPRQMDLDSKLSDQLRGIPRSGIRDFFELVIGRTDVISLGVGEPDKPTPWPIREAAIRSLEKGQTSYTSNLGLESLRIAIAAYVEQQFRTRYGPKTEILVTVGVSEALDLAFRAVLNPGDEVIFHQPCYVSYGPSITMAYGVPVPVNTRLEDNFALRASDVEKAITPKTKVLTLNFPTNPTGAIEPNEELEKIAQLCVKHDLLCFTDEIYSELLYDGGKHTSIVEFPGMRERTVLLHGFSKAFAMTGWRLGYTAAPKKIADAIDTIQSPTTSNPTTFAQYGALAALQMDQQIVSDMRDEFDVRRQYMLGRLSNIKNVRVVEPMGAFYFLVDIEPMQMKSVNFCEKLLSKQKVSVVPGLAFGAEHTIRFSYATGLDVINAGMDRFEEFCSQH